MYLIGIDIGTTNTKVTLYKTNGEMVANHSEPTIRHNDGSGKIHYIPGEIWDAACKGIRAVLSEIDNVTDVATVSACSAGEALVAIDKSGQEIGQSFPWNDPRTRELGTWWKEHFTDDEIYGLTGEPALSKNGVNHMLWIRKNQPDVFKKAARWLHLSDFITYKLSGEAVTNYPIVGCTMLYHNERKDWWDEMLNAAGIDRSILTPLADSGTLLGSVCKRAQEETGLSGNTKVAVGGHDHITAALACNVVRAGDTINSMGTAETLMRITDKLLPPDMVVKAGVINRPHVVPGKYYISGSLPNGSGTIDWAFEQIGQGNNFEDNLNEALNAVAGCNGIVFIPHLLGSGTPSNDDLARGAFIGIRGGTTRGEFLRAVHEGLVYEMRTALENVNELTGAGSGKIVGVSGGFRNPLIRQLKADITGREFYIPEITEAATLGAALLGGIGAGVYSGYEQAAEQIQRKEAKVMPNNQNVEFYSDIFYKVYTNIYRTIKPINDTMSG